MENNSKQISHPYIVGIGSSAGDLEALTSMVKNIPKNSKICFLLIQHIENNYVRLLPETLCKKTGLNVEVATNNLVPKSNTLYILPSNKNITLKKGKIQIQDWEHSRSPNLPINTFFNSLVSQFISLFSPQNVYLLTISLLNFNLSAFLSGRLCFVKTCYPKS